MRRKLFGAENSIKVTGISHKGMLGACSDFHCMVYDRYNERWKDEESDFVSSPDAFSIQNRFDLSRIDKNFRNGDRV